MMTFWVKKIQRQWSDANLQDESRCNVGKLLKAVSHPFLIRFWSISVHYTDWTWHAESKKHDTDGPTPFSIMTAAAIFEDNLKLYL